MEATGTAYLRQPGSTSISVSPGGIQMERFSALEGLPVNGGSGGTMSGHWMPIGSSSFEAPVLGKVLTAIPSYQTETIREWWIGHVVDINMDEGYFTADLRDMKGIESRAEFEIEGVFVNEKDAAESLFPGAEFAFYVVTKHGKGRPQTSSKLEFTSPYVWRHEDDDKVRELFSKLFPDDEPL